MGKNTISVIIPIYKVEQYLRRCLDSILSQTYTDFHIILVDDGSPDGCPAICDEYVEKDSRVHVIHKKNGGVSTARNAGMDYIYTHHPELLGEYVAFIDSDDWVHPQYFETLVGAMQDADIILCKNTWVYENSEVESAALKPEMVMSRELTIPEILSGDASIFIWARLYRSSLIQKFRFHNDLCFEDELFDMDIFCSKPTLRCRFIDVPLYYYLQRSISLIHTMDPMRYEGLIAYFCQKMLCLDDKTAVQMLLDKIIKRYLATRYAAAVMEVQDAYRRCDHGVKQCVRKLRSSEVIPLKRRVGYVVFAYMPFLYRQFRIIDDPTLVTWERQQRQKRKNNKQ